MKSVFVAIVLLLLTTPLYAQTHPCDVVPAVNPTIVNKTIVVGLCHDGKDLNGDSTILTAIKVYIDGTVVLTWNNPSPSQGPSATGYSYYLTPAIPVSKGAKILITSAVDADAESPLSMSYSFRVKGPGPKPTAGQRVQ